MIDKCKELDQQIARIHLVEQHLKNSPNLRHDSNESSSTAPNSSKSTQSSKPFKWNLKSKLISKRKRLHKDLNCLRNVYSTRRQLSWLRIREFVHRNLFHRLLNTRSFHSTGRNLLNQLDSALPDCNLLDGSPLDQRSTSRQQLVQRLTCFTLDACSLFACSLSFTYARVRLYLRLFYFRFVRLVR